MDYPMALFFILALAAECISAEPHRHCSIDFRHIMVPKEAAKKFGPQSALIAYTYSLDSSSCNSLDSLVLKSKTVIKLDGCLDGLDAAAIIVMRVVRKSEMEFTKLTLTNCDNLKYVAFEKSGKLHKEKLPAFIENAIQLKKALADSLHYQSVDSANYWITGT